jgi:hypothetical protein
MAADKDLEIVFGADITEFTGNIAQVINGIKKFREQAKTASVNELPAINAKIAEYIDGLKRLKALGTPTADSIKKVRDSASDARVALTNVSQVVQDLPFGFIGIQNNIPGVIQAFGNLTSGSTGLAGGLKAISAQLIGPAGIFLAFSLATSAVTGLITKYGSLGAGLEAVFGGTVKVTEAQKDYNKALSESVGSSAAEVIEINALVRILGDLSLPLKERYAAYVELNKIRPEVIAGITEESLATGDYTKQLDINAIAIKNLIFLEAKRAALSSVINKNVADQTALEQERPRLIADLIKAQKAEAEDAKKRDAGLKATGRFRSQESINLELATNAYAENVKKGNDLIKVYKEFSDALTPVITNIANVDGATKTLTESQKKAEEAAKKAADAAKEKAKWDKIDADNLALIEKYTPKKQFPLIGAVQLNKEGVDFGKLMTKDQPIELFDINSFQVAYDTFIQGIFDKTDFLKAVLADKIKNLNLPAPKLPQLTALGQAFIDSGLSLEDFEKNLEDTFNRTYNFIKDLLINPLETLFDDVLTKGETSWQKFGQTILDVLNKLIIKLAAAAVVAGILAILTGGASATPGSGISTPSNAGSFSKIFGSLLGINKASNPSFGGVQGGGVGMSGSVNLTLRGTDLVGAINRTNSQISRVG